MEQILSWITVAAALALFALACVRCARAGVRQARGEAGWSGCLCGVRSDRVALASIAWTVGVKLAVMLLAYLVLDVGGDLFEGAAAFWGRSDAHHYMNIAEIGYTAEGESGLYIVFFPLYPYALRVLGFLTGEYFWTGSLLSMACTSAAGYYMFQLASLEHGEAAGWRALKYFMLFPAMFFSGLPFTEGMFLLLTAAALFAVRRHRYMQAGALGMLCALTRSVGMLIVVPFAVEVICDAWQGRAGRLKRILKTGWPVLLVPLGTLAYLAINWLVTGSALTFLTIQREHWHQSMSWLGDTVQYVTRNALTYDMRTSLALWVPQLVMVFVVLGVLAATARGQRPMYIAYALVLLWFSLSVTWLLSGPRYLMAVLPFFMGLAALCRRRLWDWIVTVVLAAGLLAYSLAFASGLPIY